MDANKKSINDMRVFAQANLATLCVELAEWQDTGLLPDGKMRELARLCVFDPTDRLRHAERMVEHEAIRLIAGANT